MIKMMHPQHGFHMASSLEEPDMRKNGWVEAPTSVAEPEPVQPVVKPVEAVAAQEDSAHGKRPYNRKAK